MSAYKTRVVGLGSAGAGDDALGLEAVAMLRSRLPCTVDVLSDESGGANIPEFCVGVDDLIIIDAVKPSLTFPPGAISAWSYPAARSALCLSLSRNTHSFSVMQGLALAEQLGILPKNVTIFGMAGENFQPATGLSETVRLQLGKLLELVLRHLECATACTSCPADIESR